MIDFREEILAQAYPLGVPQIQLPIEGLAAALALQDGVVFVAAIWSVHSMLSLKALCTVAATIHAHFPILVLDTDALDYSAFKAHFGEAPRGGGEAYWINGGRIVHADHQYGKKEMRTVLESRVMKWGQGVSVPPHPDFHDRVVALARPLSRDRIDAEGRAAEPLTTFGPGVVFVLDVGFPASRTMFGLLCRLLAKSEGDYPVKVLDISAVDYTDFKRDYGQTLERAEGFWIRNGKVVYSDIYYAKSEAEAILLMESRAREWSRGSLACPP